MLQCSSFLTWGKFSPKICRCVLQNFACRSPSIWFWINVIYGSKFRFSLVTMMTFDILTKWHCDKNCVCCKYMELYINILLFYLELLPPQWCVCTLWVREGILRSLKMRCFLVTWQSYQSLCKAHLLLGMSTHNHSN